MQGILAVKPGVGLDFLVGWDFGGFLTDFVMQFAFITLYGTVRNVLSL